MKLKRCIALALTVVCAASVMGCAQEAAQTTPDGNVELTVTYGLGELGNGNTTVEEVFAGFLEEHPNVTISIEPAVGSDPKVLAMIAAGNPPNIIRLNTVEDIPTYVTRNMLVPLDDYMEKSENIDMDDFTEAASYLRFDGKEAGKGPYYAAYKDWSVDTQMWINKRLFQEAGLDIPSQTEPMTFEELADCAKKLTKVEDGQVVQMGFSSVLNTQQIIEYMLSTEGGSIWNEDFSGTTLLTDEKTKKAFEYMVDVQKANAFESDINPVNQDMAWFTSGKTAIFMAGYWATANLSKAIEAGEINADDYMMIPSPVVEKGTRHAAIICGTGAGIMAAADNRDLTYELWEYIHFGELADLRAQQGFGMPMTKSRMSMLPQDSPFQKAAYDSVMEEIKHLGNGVRVSPYVGVSSITSSIKKFYSPVLFETSTLDDALASMDEDFTMLTDEGKQIAGVE